MKTLKYEGRTYEVIDIQLDDSPRSSDMYILAGFERDGIYRFLHFDAIYFKNLENVDVRCEDTGWLTRRSVELMAKFVQKSEKEQEVNS